MFEYAGHECTLCLSPSMVFNLKWYFRWTFGISPKGQISAPSCHPLFRGRGSNDVNVLCSWARQLRQIFAAFPEKFGGPDARGERCALLGGQQLWYLGIDWSVQVPRRFFCWSFIFWEFANCKFCFLKWYSTPWFFAGFWSSNGSVLPFFPLVFRRSPHPCFAIGCLWISLLRPEPTFLPPRCYRTAMWRKRLSGKDWTSLWPVDWPWELVAIWRWE